MPMSETILLALISALGGGFLGSVIQSIASSKNSNTEREFRERLAAIERYMKALEVETERSWRDKIRFEERYFNLKIEYYVPLYALILQTIDNLDDKESIKNCFSKLYESSLIFDGSVREYFNALIDTPKDDNDALQKSLAALAAALSIDIVERHCLGLKKTKKQGKRASS